MNVFGMSSGTVIVDETREENIFDGLDSWQSDFENDARSSRQDEDADWWQEDDSDGQGGDDGEVAERIDCPRAKADCEYDDGTAVGCSDTRCTLADTTAAHLKYGIHLTDYGYIFGANEWRHEYPMTSFDLGSKNGFTCSEQDATRLVLEALLGCPNDLFDLAPTPTPTDVRDDPSRFSPLHKTESCVEQRFVLSFAATSMSVSSGLSASTLRATLEWFARLASDIHHCRRFACGELAPSSTSAGTRPRGDASASASLLTSLREVVRAAVLEALVHVETALCELDGSLLPTGADGRSAALASDPMSSRLTLISLYRRVSLCQWAAVFRSLRAQVATVTASGDVSSTAPTGTGHPHAVADVVANGVLQALFAVQRWRGNTGVQAESADSIFLPLHMHMPMRMQSDGDETVVRRLVDRNGRGLKTDQGPGLTAELALFLRRLQPQRAFSPSRETPATLGSRVDFVVGRLVLVREPTPPSPPSSLPMGGDRGTDRCGGLVAAPAVPVGAPMRTSTRTRSSGGGGGTGSLSGGLGGFQPGWTNRDDLLGGLGSGSGTSDSGSDSDSDSADADGVTDGDDADAYTDREDDCGDEQHVDDGPSGGASLRMLGMASQLMPLSARLDLLVSLPAARARRRRDAEAVRFVREECHFMAHVQFVTDLFLLRDQGIFEPLRAELLDETWFVDQATRDARPVPLASGAGAPSNRKSQAHVRRSAARTGAGGSPFGVLHSATICENLTHRVQQRVATLASPSPSPSQSSRHCRFTAAFALDLTRYAGDTAPPSSLASSSSGAMAAQAAATAFMRQLVLEVHYARPLSDVFAVDCVARCNDIMAHLLQLAAARWAADGAWMASMRMSSAFLPSKTAGSSYSSSTSSMSAARRGSDTAPGPGPGPGSEGSGDPDGRRTRAKCRAGLSMLVHTLSVVQTYYMRAIHGRIVPLYAPSQQSQSQSQSVSPADPYAATQGEPDIARAATHATLFETCTSVSELSRQYRDLVGSVGSVVGLAGDEALQLSRIGFAAATAVRGALCMMRWLEGDAPSSSSSSASASDDYDAAVLRFRCDPQGVEVQLQAAAQLFDEFRAAVRQFAAALTLHAVGDSQTSGADWEPDEANRFAMYDAKASARELVEDLRML